MAYSGYLIKSNGVYSIPLEYMAENSYKCTYNTLDMDSYRDGEGILHRNVILQTPTAKFTTRTLNNTQMASLLNSLSANFIIPAERKSLLSVYVPEKDTYITGYFYMPDFELTIKHIRGNVITYEPLTLEFIGTGETS